ncbi:MAG TPA: ABC transporter permease [Draconibacterium sp.]|nr:ABC transporter permease [Draconibacterium sp.]
MKLFRKIKQNWKWFAINIIGLSIALACVLIIFLHAMHERSYDRFHTKAGQIYRATTDSNNGATSMHPARVAGDWPKQLMSGYPAIEKMVRLVPFRKAIIKIGNQKFYSEHAFSTDSSFFDVFDFKVLSGNPETAFSQPGRAFISRSLAMKYFGSIIVVGKEISILHQQEPNPKLYVIDGVMEDFPVNSHFHAELLTSFTEVADQTTWAYTYFLMKKGTDTNALRNTIQQNWEKENKTGSVLPILHLQKLTDIHLFSHKTREMEKNGDIRSIILLISGAFIVLLIALINYMNLAQVQFIDRIKSLKIRIINGASKTNLTKEIVLDSLVVSVVSSVIAVLVSARLSELLRIPIFRTDSIIYILSVSAAFILIVALLALFPLFTSKLVSDTNINIAKNRLYSFPLIFQFAMAVAAISCTIVLNRQINFINNQHPEANNANMVVIPDNPWESVQRFELLKGELMKNPLITIITAAMEEPGGDIIDAVNFEMEGIDKKEGQSINIFTVDPNFFNMLKIHSIAGTIDFGNTPSQKWETDAVELSTLRKTENADPKKIAELEKNLGVYREKYVLNESALKLLGIRNPEDAIGKRFRLNFFLPDLFPEGEVVGVVSDFHYTNLYSEEKPLAIAPRKMFNYCFIIGIDPSQREKAITTINSTWQKINPDFPLQYEFLTDSYQKVYAGEFAQNKVLSLFALASIILSSLGIFALSAFNLQRRVKEIGIRKVNGARVSEVLVLLNKGLIRWVAFAFVISTPDAWFAMHKWLENFAYKTSLSWWIFVCAGILVLITSLLTVSFQSWRAATRNPVDALRYE